MTTLQTIEKESNTIQEQVDNLEINHKEDMIRATTLLSSLNRYNDAVITELEKVTIPLKTALKAEESRFKPTITRFKGAIQILRDKMGQYQTNAIADRLEAEKKIADRIKAGKGNLSLEKGIEKIASLDTVENKTETDAGSVSFMEVKDFEVMEMEMLPMEYHTANEVKIRADMKKGIEVKGVRYFTKQVPRNIR